MKNYTDKLIGMVDRGERETPRYQKLCTELTEKREAKKEVFYEHTKEMLKRLVPEAEKRGIKLGVENRQALEELPIETDTPFLFKEISSPALVYWHDTGHAQIKENLGFIRHTLQIDSMSDRLAGFHVHDVQFAGRDHCAPGTGKVDFASLAPMVKPAHIKVFEFSPSLNLDQVKSGVGHVKRLWGEE